jgi:hypothetical protein
MGCVCCSEAPAEVSGHSAESLIQVDDERTIDTETALEGGDPIKQCKKKGCEVLVLRKLVYCAEHRCSYLHLDGRPCSHRKELEELVCWKHRIRRTPSANLSMKETLSDSPIFKPLPASYQTLGYETGSGDVQLSFGSFPASPVSVKASQAF